MKVVSVYCDFEFLVFKGTNRIVITSENILTATYFLKNTAAHSLPTHLDQAKRCSKFYKQCRYANTNN